ncbi:MAG: histidine kinase dimerization/phospho-acceptor domain-containing protein [Bdellovibrio sp.]|jgi:two-component system NtrC family sensor kinase
MPSLGSSVLIVSTQGRPQIALDFELTPSVDKIPDFPRANILVLPALLASSSSFFRIFTELFKKNPSLLLLLIAGTEADEEVLRQVIHQFPVFRILESFEDPALEISLLEALERTQWNKQNEQLRFLVGEQNEKLKALYQTLEDRVAKRTRFLEEARRKSLLAQARWEAIRQATVAIHQSSSIPEMEQRLLEVLARSMALSTVKIVPGTTHNLPPDPRLENFVCQRVTLFNSQEKPEGTVLFLRGAQHPYTAEEKDFFQLLAETLNPALQRLGTLKTRESFKEEWEATFNAVADPVGIFNSSYEIVQTNSSFQRKSGQTDLVAGLKCYQALFHRESPCTGCKRGENFRLESRRDTFDVSGQVVHLSPDEEPVFVHQYHDVTEQVRMERRILESARLAELGTIGSSIAHELNNPLGGILSYVQLLKMDLPLQDPLRIDIEEMERGVLRCRDIVQNLLNFTRSPGQEQRTQVDLRDVLRRALGILILKTRSQGIEVKTDFPEEPVWVEGHFNQLTQALQNVLQSSLSSIQEKLITQKGFQPVLEVVLQIQERDISLSILDNGRGLETAPSLEIPLAQRILIEHGASLEISFQPRALRMAKISFPRLVLAP